jgi:hypothetical protein
MTPGREDVARLAYLYWEAGGFQGGSPEEDWFRAEEELKHNSPADHPVPENELPLIVEDDIQQRTVNLDFTVVLDET